MAYPQFGYSSYPNYYQPQPMPQPMPDPMAQMRQNQMQQPPMQPNMMQQNQPTTSQVLQSIPPVTQQNNGIVWCQGEEGAKAYLTAPGSSVMLMDSEKNTFYIKSSDQSGMPLPLRIFDYTERTSTNKTPNPIIQSQNVDYVTREEFEALEAKINSLSVKEQPKGRKSQKEDNQSDS